MGIGLSLIFRRQKTEKVTIGQSGRGDEADQKYENWYWDKRVGSVREMLSHLNSVTIVLVITDFINFIIVINEELALATGAAHHAGKIEKPVPLFHRQWQTTRFIIWIIESFLKSLLIDKNDKSLEGKGFRWPRSCIFLPGKTFFIAYLTIQLLTKYL